MTFYDMVKFYDIFVILCCVGPLSSVPSRVRNLRKMRKFWAYFTDFEPEINIIGRKTEKLKHKT